MNSLRRFDQEEKPIRQLYACLDVESGEIFYASFINQRGSYMEMRSSQKLARGKEIHMAPVPENWDGTKHTPDDIQNYPQKLSGHVSRAESRGQFQISLVTQDQQDAVDQIYSGGHRDTLEIEQIRAGMIEIIKLSGRISVDSMGRLQSILRSRPGETRLVLLDVRQLISIPNSCLAMLHTLIKNEMEHGLLVNFLAKPFSRVQEEIKDSRILDVCPLHEEYEIAAAYLIQSIID
ncbi:MAG: STAS domain-containing protein [Candidatus Omnitrophica bacterium]|nr:STAS domain-containing protein [Candidatus Omnitrophota bacterium]